MSNSESTDVDEFRKKHAVNTYNNKVFGNLYLVASLNVIDSIGVSTFGYRNTTDVDVSYDDIEVTVPAKMRLLSLKWSINTIVQTEFMVLRTVA